MTEQIGDYNILKKVGAGGMAQVYLGVHRDVPNLKVVLKVLSDPRLVERFKQEADKLALLAGNGNICQIKHFFNHGAEIVIAMEYIEGTTLDEIIKGRGKMELHESVKIIHDVLTTLEFAHSKKIAHRDIKPSNIMIDESGQIKIIDFGIAKAETDPDLTIAGAAVGTPAYMAPEQFTPTEKTNYDQIDVYAVGTMFYYMLTGELPFKGDNQFILREAKLFSEPTKPRDLDREIPRQVEEIILKSLKRDPEERYKTAKEMCEALARLPIEKGISAETELVDTSTVTKAEKKKSSGLKKLSIPAFIIFVAVASYLTFFQKEEGGQLLPPELLSPANKASLKDGRPQFVWQASVGKNLRYILQYATDAEFSNAQTVSDLLTPRYLPDDTLSDGKYYWRVQTFAGGDSSEYSRVFSFNVELAPPEIPQGRLELTIRPSGDIYIDGDRYANNQKSAELILDTGKHVVVVRNGESIQKLFDETVTITANTKTTRQYNFTFAADTGKTITKPPKSEFGHLSVGSKPINGAMVFINDRLEDHLTPFTFKLKAGQYVIRVNLTLDGTDKSLTDTILVAADSTSKLIFDFEN